LAYLRFSFILSYYDNTQYPNFLGLQRYDKDFKLQRGELNIYKILDALNSVFFFHESTFLQCIDYQYNELFATL